MQKIVFTPFENVQTKGGGAIPLPAGIYNTRREGYPTNNLLLNQVVDWRYQVDKPSAGAGFSQRVTREGYLKGMFLRLTTSVGVANREIEVFLTTGTTRRILWYYQETNASKKVDIHLSKIAHEFSEEIIPSTANSLLVYGQLLPIFMQENDFIGITVGNMDLADQIDAIEFYQGVTF